MRYRVEVARWTGSDDGARDLEDRLNELADEGWELVFIIPTLADTSIRALVGAASAGTSEVALVLQRVDAIS
jgi:NTP pyrophosphatase (non-canonical NTP hydrolase)